MSDGIVDQFLVELGIDPSGVEVGAKEATAKLNDLINKANAGGKKAEDGFNKVGGAFEKTARSALGFVSLVLGGITITKMASDIVQTDKNIGILSDTTGVAVVELSKWRLVFERLGGSAEGPSNMFRGIAQELQALAVGGSFESSSLIKVLNALNTYGVKIKSHDEKGAWLSPDEIVKNIADAIPNMKASKSNITGWLRQLPGTDEATVAVLMRGGKLIREELVAQEKIEQTTDKDRLGADRLLKAYKAMTQSGEQFGRTLLESLSKPLEGVFNLTTKFLKEADSHQKEMSKSWEQRDYEFRTARGLPVYTGYFPGAVRGVDGKFHSPTGSNEPLPTPSDGTRLDERGAHLTNNGVSVKPWLLDTVREASKFLPPGYKAKVISAVDARASTPWHPRGDAIDIKIYDDKGTPVVNIGPGPQYTVYERMALAAKKIQIQKYPNEKFIWGGHFNSGVPFDLMHFQSGGVSARDFTKEQVNGPLPNATWPEKTPTLPFQMRGIGNLIGGKAVINNNTTTKTDVGELTVNSQAADPVGIAADIHKALQNKASPAN